MESIFKNVKNNELIPLVDLMIDHAKQAEVCNLGPDAQVYTTRAKTEEKPELVSMHTLRLTFFRVRSAAQRDPYSAALALFQPLR